MQTSLAPRVPDSTRHGSNLRLHATFSSTFETGCDISMLSSQPTRRPVGDIKRRYRCILTFMFQDYIFQLLECDPDGSFVRCPKLGEKNCTAPGRAAQARKLRIESRLCAQKLAILPPVWTTYSRHRVLEMGLTLASAPDVLVGRFFYDTNGRQSM